MCDAWMIDLDADGTEEIVLMEKTLVFAFRLTDQTSWVRVGSWMLPPGCEALSAEMIAGNFATKSPEPSRWPDLEISGLRFRLRESAPVPSCPN